ncbi:hypothetical protein BD779DRAFT_1125414 [Infundibulicybe gibba]|nr:hypothetical protein BD779DRAFT_1125414 [Infundibulicybe gibba]
MKCPELLSTSISIDSPKAKGAPIQVACPSPRISARIHRPENDEYRNQDPISYQVGDRPMMNVGMIQTHV